MMRFLWILVIAALAALTLTGCARKVGDRDVSYNPDGTQIITLEHGRTRHDSVGDALNERDYNRAMLDNSEAVLAQYHLQLQARDMAAIREERLHSAPAGTTVAYYPVLVENKTTNDLTVTYWPEYGAGVPEKQQFVLASSDARVLQLPLGNYRFSFYDQQRGKVLDIIKRLPNGGRTRSHQPLYTVQGVPRLTTEDGQQYYLHIRLD